MNELTEREKVILRVATSYKNFPLADDFEEHLEKFEANRMAQIREALKQLSDEHYFLKWASDNFESFHYDLSYGGAVCENCEIFGDDSFDCTSIIVTTFKNHTVVIQLKSDEIYKNFGKKLS